MAYENEIPMFSEQLARRISYTERPLLGYKELIRAWKPSTNINRASALAYVNAYVSSKNTVASSTITDPQADSHGSTPDGAPKNVYSGLWRHVGTDWDGRIEEFVQTLRFGFASTVLTPVTNPPTARLPNDECHILAGSAKPDDGRSMVLFWKNINPAYVKACQDELRTASAFTNPVIDGVTHTGKWIIDEVMPEELQADGSFTIKAMCYMVQTTTPEADARFVDMVRHNQDGKLELVRRWPAIDPSVSTSLLISNANTNVTSAVVTDPQADGKTYTGTWNAITTREVKANGYISISQSLTASGTRKLLVITGRDSEHTVYEFYRWNYTEAEVQLFKAQSGSEAPTGGEPTANWATPENAKTKMIRVTKNEGALFDIYAIYSAASLPAGYVAGIQKHSSVVVDWASRTRDFKVPIYTTSTNSDEGSQVTGYNIYEVTRAKSRTITTTVTRSFSITEVAAENAVGSPGATDGEGTSQFIDVEKIGESLWAVFTKTVVTSPWVLGAVTIEGIGAVGAES